MRNDKVFFFLPTGVKPICGINVSRSLINSSKPVWLFSWCHTGLIWRAKVPYFALHVQKQLNGLFRMIIPKCTEAAKHHLGPHEPIHTRKEFIKEITETKIWGLFVIKELCKESWLLLVIAGVELLVLHTRWEAFVLGLHGTCHRLWRALWVVRKIGGKCAQKFVVEVLLFLSPLCPWWARAYQTWFDICRKARKEDIRNGL